MLTAEQRHTMTEITLTKQISKQGNQAVIIIPKFLQEKLKPKNTVEIKIKILEEFKTGENQ